MLFLIFISEITSAQRKTKYDPQKKYNPDSLKRWTRILMKDLSLKHPGFYRYTSKANFDLSIDSTLLTVNDSLTEIEIYRKLKPLIAKIRCVHTQLTLSPGYLSYLKQFSNVIPIEIFIDSAKHVFITKFYGRDSLHLVTQELVSINNKPIKAILTELLASIPADGYNETGKIRLLNYRFPLWYRSMIESPNEFSLTVTSGNNTRSVIVGGVNESVIPSMDSLVFGTRKMIQFFLKENVGVLTILTFDNRQIKHHGQRFRKTIRKSFQALRKNNVKNLVIDIRNNTGGTDSNAAFLARYIHQRPYHYWDRIEVTQAIAAELKGLARFIYCKPLRKDSIYLFTKSKFSHVFDYYQLQYPETKNNFRGNVFILTNGLCLSSCSDFAGIVSYNTGAAIVGEESGGGYQGNTSGIMPKAKFETNLILTVPLLKYTNKVDPVKNVGHGTYPDFPVAETLNSWMNHQDIQMEYVLDLIKEKSIGSGKLK